MRLIFVGTMLSAMWLFGFVKVLAQATLDSEKGFAWTVFAATGLVIAAIWKEYLSNRSAEFKRVIAQNAELIAANDQLENENKALAIKLAIYEVGKVADAKRDP